MNYTARGTTDGFVEMIALRKNTGSSVSKPGWVSTYIEHFRRKKKRTGEFLAIAIASRLVERSLLCTSIIYIELHVVRNALFARNRT